MSAISQTSMLPVSQNSLFNLESYESPSDKDLKALFNQNTDTSTQDPLIPIFSETEIAQMPSQPDLIVLFCQKYPPIKPKEWGERNIENNYVRKFERLKPTDKLEVLARISPSYFVRLFFSKLPSEMRTRYMEIASSLAPTSANSTQLRLDTISKYKKELALP